MFQRIRVRIVSDDSVGISIDAVKQILNCVERDSADCVSRRAYIKVFEGVEGSEVRETLKNYILPVARGGNGSAAVDGHTGVGHSQALIEIRSKGVANGVVGENRIVGKIEFCSVSVSTNLCS